MATIQCKKCNEVFKNMREMLHHICSKEYKKELWKNPPGGRGNNKPPKVPKIQWRVLI